MKHILLIVSVVLMFADCFAQNSRKDKTVADLQPQQQTQSWQQIFPDPLLQNYIAEALDSNSDLRIAQLALEQSEAMLKSAKLSYLPSFSFAQSALVSKAQSTPSSFTYELPVTMNWELNFGGKQHYQKEMAKLQLQKDTAQLKYARIQIVAELDGARNDEELKNVFLKSVHIIALISAGLVIVTQFLARPLALLFAGYDSDLLELTVMAFHIYSISFLLAGFNGYVSSFFTALNNGVVSAVLATARTLVFETIAVLVLPLVFGLDGIWFAVILAEIMALVLSLLMLRKYRERYHYV